MLQVLKLLKIVYKYMDELSICEIESIRAEIINSMNWDDYVEEEEQLFCCCFPSNLFGF
jgi:hypothetical protein